MAAAVAGALLAHAPPASSAGGTLDTTFGVSGVRTIDHGSASDDVVVDLALQSDGKVVVSTGTGDGFALSRLTTAGALDTTYGSAGTVADDFMIDPVGLALDANGRALVVGRTASSGGELVLARYSTAGDLDTNFGTAGIVEVSMTGAGSGGRDVVVQSDAKIVVLAVDDGELVLHRFSSTGVADTTFGSAGVVETGATPGEGDRVVVQSDGAVVVTGVVSGDAGVLRYSSTGALDTTFGASGVATTDGHVVRALALQSDGKILTAGDDGTTEALVARRTTAGALDTAFGTAGVFEFAVPGLSQPSVRGMVLASDGKAVLVGRRDDSADSSVVFVARLTTAGALDTTFATSGIVTFTTLGGKGTSTASAVGLDSTGRAVVGGAVVDGSDLDATVARVTTADGQTTTTSTTATTASAGQLVDAGETLRTHGSATEVSDDVPLTVSLKTPVDGTASLQTHDEPVTDYDNLRTVASATVTAPTATAANPLVLTFNVYAGLFPPSFPLGSIVVARNGVTVEPCEMASVADPDPCVSSRVATSTAVTVQVLSTAGSEWDIGVPDLERLSGDDRIATAIAVSRSSFPDDSADAVVLVRSDSFADALAATPLAADENAPLLLTGSAGLDDSVLEEIIRVLPDGETVFLLGGTAALATAVEDRLSSWGYDHVRYAGTDRYETAVAVAERGLGSPGVVIETTGEGFADALAAGAVAREVGGAVLLTAGANQSAATARYLARYQPTRYAIGGPAALADPGATSIVGTDRYETAVLTAIRFFTDPAVLGIASGASFADALAGGAHIALSGGPLLLVPATGALPVSVTIYLESLASDPPTAFLYGGTGSVDSSVETLLTTAIDRTTG